MVITTSERSTTLGSSFFGASPDISIPHSAMAWTATGLIWSAGADPADLTSIRPIEWCWSNAAAIWLLPALWMHTNSTDGVSVILDGLLA